MTFRSDELVDGGQCNEEDLRVALIDPSQVGAAYFDGSPAPTFSVLCAPVLELADRRGLQPRAHSGHPGPTPGWGITP